MSFTAIMVLLVAMGIWVLYLLLRVVPRLQAKAAASGDDKKKKPVLYWIIIAAQVLFALFLLFRLTKS